MFGLGTKTSMTPFSHSDKCRHKDEQPEWSSDARGLDRRTCGWCGQEETRAQVTGQLDPRTQSPEPAPSAHLHAGACPGVAIVVRDEERGGWRSWCPLCTSTTLYWWQAVYLEAKGEDPVRQHRIGNLLYTYPTVDPNPPAAPYIAARVVHRSDDREWSA
jgi:hypothetical protein